MVREQKPWSTFETATENKNEDKAVVSEVLPTALSATSHDFEPPPAGDEEPSEAESGDTDALDPNPSDENQPVTILVSRNIKTDCEAEFEKLLAQLCELLQQHEGFVEMKAYKPSDETDEHKVMLSFESAAALKTWQSSDERKEWMARAKPLEKEPPRAQVLTGIESWFTLPEQEGMTPPPKQKMTVVTWMGIFPLVTLTNFVLAPYIEHFPIVAQSAITSVLLTVLMTYVVMPRMTRLFAGYLYPQVKLPQNREKSD